MKQNSLLLASSIIIAIMGFANLGRPLAVLAFGALVVLLLILLVLNIVSKVRWKKEHALLPANIQSLHPLNTPFEPMELVFLDCAFVGTALCLLLKHFQFNDELELALSSVCVAVILTLIIYIFSNIMAAIQEMLANR